MRNIALAIVVGLVVVGGAWGEEPPVLPVGLDAYREWHRWPQQRIGARAYMRSTYDRLGGNLTADASTFLYQENDQFNVTLDVAGAGVLYFARYNHWHGSPWHYEVDGKDHIVQETSTKDPNKPVEGSVFMPEELFPNPLTWTWSITKGADLMWVPIPFEKSFRMAYTRTCYGTGYYIYHQYVRGIPLSQPIAAWDGKRPPDRDVLELIKRAGTELVPKADSAEGRRMGIVEQGTTFSLDATHGTLRGGFGADVKGPHMVRALLISAPKEKALELSKVRLHIEWDDRKDASVDAPLPLFFGAGTLYNRDNKEYLVKAFPMNIRFDDRRVYLACYYPMPFFKSMYLGFVAEKGVKLEGMEYELRMTPLKDPPSHWGYFHATYKDHGTPERGKDLVCLDTRGVEGSEVWSGSFVGMSWIFSHNAVLNTLEGDPRFFFDDSQTPQAQGTGTEEWGGGGDYWGGRTMTLPFAGHPVGAPNQKAVKAPEDKIESAYRFLLADLMPFGRNARIQLEHGAVNDSVEHYETVTYWYGAPAASLVKSDTFQVGDVESEKAHAYVSPAASEVEEVTSRYEWGPDRLGGVEIYPAHTDKGRHTTGTSEFTMKLEAKNFGVMLRRKLDYQFPNQRAEVFIADASGGREVREEDFKAAGVWYLAGSSTSVHSRPNEELGATLHNVRVSNRRFRDDEFLVPRDLTEGRSAVRVRVRFVPVERPLFPGHPVPKLAWSEMRYDAYCWVMPKWDF